MVIDLPKNKIHKANESSMKMASTVIDAMVLEFILWIVYLGYNVQEKQI